MAGRERVRSELRGIGRFFKIAPTLAGSEAGLLRCEYG